MTLVSHGSLRLDANHTELLAELMAIAVTQEHLTNFRMTIISRFMESCSTAGRCRIQGIHAQQKLNHRFIAAFRGEAQCRFAPFVPSSRNTFIAPKEQFVDFEVSAFHS
jgi:hypothetical protein